MKGTMKCLGLVALVAVIGFSFAVCEQPIETTPSTLTGITAVYIQGAAIIYPNTPHDSLKAGLTVTAQYSDNTSKTVTDYSLSGALTTGVSTVTVTYTEDGITKTDTFTVDVATAPATYTVEQTGGEDGITTSTGIVFTFSESVDGLNLSAADITIGGTASKGSEELTGTGTTRTLSIIVHEPGTATVSITKSGIEAETKHVTVYKEGETAPTLTGITADYIQGAAIIYPTTPLDDLKDGLTVKAQYSNSDEETLSESEYALSVEGGTLTVGTSTVTVSYTDRVTQTASFTVNVTALPATWTAVQTGGADGTATSTGIIFTFSESVDGLNLSAADITVGGAASKGTAALTGTGAMRTLAITVNEAGTAAVSINKSGIEAETKHVTVYKSGQNTPVLIIITAAYTQGATIVYPTTPLDNLKAALTVKARYTVGSEITLSESEYTLSGALTVGSSTITVTHQGKTANFTVNVTAVPEYWHITWHLDGGAAGTGAYPAQIIKGTVLAQPSPNPTKDGNTFGGWYSDSGFTQPWAFGNSVTANMDLYARWLETVTAPTITTASLPNGTVGTAYSQTLTAAGSAEITWSITDPLPGGLALSGDTIAGTPTTVGTSSFTVTAVNTYGTHSKQLSITITSSGASMSEAIELTENTWADGSLPTSSSQQWFVFTATASTQYIHVAFGSLSATGGIYVQVYAGNGTTTVGSETNLYSNTRNTSRSLTSGQTYYIRVRPYSSTGSGTYQIGFTTSTTAPANVPVPFNAIPLTENQWADGSLPTSSDVQWFSFTATASTQYIHAAFGTLSNLYVNVYTGSGAAVGSETYLSGSTRNTSRTLEAGQMYYIRVRPYSSSYSGAYWIGFNASTVAPANVQLPFNAIPLTANQWADGSLPTSSSQQWFVFTATASTQNIHFKFDTLTQLYANVYDSSGAVVGNETSLSGSTSSFIPNTSRSLTAGQTYYIRVRPYSSSYSGSYRIGFNASFLSPSGAIPLTATQWTDGSLSTNDYQWFSFTATASTQYIHFDFGTLLATPWVYACDSSGAAVGSEVGLGSPVNARSPLEVGQTYYIRVRQYSGGGSYRITFSTTTFPPGFTYIQLTENQWADGSFQPSDDYYQWFRFTASESTHYIHFEPGTLAQLSVAVYNSSGTTIVTGGATTLSISATSTSRSLTPRQTYYIRVSRTGSNNGDYRIAFNATPGINTIPLTENQWADNSLPTSNNYQWFRFTASESTHYIHFEPGTLTSLYVQVYDSGGTAVGSETSLSGSAPNTSRSLTPGQTYYIKVRPYSSYSGSYRIAFSASTAEPPTQLPPNAIPLTENQWANGSLPTSSDQQWFVFSATASPQFIHAAFGTLNGLAMQVYDSGGAKVGSETGLNYSYTPNTTRSLTPGQTYYIRVRPYNINDSGDYRIAFNATPAINPIPLTENQWDDNNLPTSKDYQWFTFTATASRHYIHFEFGTLIQVYVNVYDSGGSVVGSEANLYGSTTSASRTLTTGQTYYIRVRPNNSGDYRITFTATPYPPGTAFITLGTNYQWADGSLSSAGQQWFILPAYAYEQYIHVAFGTLSNLYVHMYTSGGAEVGSETNLYNATNNSTSITNTTSRSTTMGQNYYIRVRTYGSGGTYKIAYSDTLSINTIQLTANQWANGSLPTSNSINYQWFRFTANASTQIIYFEPGTLTDAYVQVYNSTGGTVYNINMNSSTPSISPSLTSGQTYYIRVRPYNINDSGDYRIAFGSNVPPGVTPIPLTVNQWANGSFPTGNDVQWFRFTATASTQYIHILFGQVSDLTIEIYNINNVLVDQQNLYGTNSSYRSIQSSLTSGQTYYIKVKPRYSSGSGGNFLIAFNTSSTAPQ